MSCDGGREGGVSRRGEIEERREEGRSRKIRGRMRW